MNAEFGGILGGQVNLQSQLDRLRSPASTRKVNKMIDANTSIVKGAGSPVKSKTDYQQVMKVRQSNVELKRLDNSISSLSDSLNEVTGVSNSFTQARDDLLAIKSIVEDALNGSLGSIEQQEAKQAEFDDLIADLDDVAKNATIGGKEVFDGNFNVTIPTGDDEGVSLDLTYNPDVVYDLAAVDKFTQTRGNDYDHFGEEIVSDSNYVVVGARDAKTFNNSGSQVDGLSSDEKELAMDDGAIQILDKSTGETFRLEVTEAAKRAGLDPKDFRNSQFGDSIAIEGNKLIVGASRIYGKDADNFNETDTEGGAFIINLDEVYNPGGDSTKNAKIKNGESLFLENSNVDGESFFGKDVELKDGKAYVSTFNGTGSTISIFDANSGSLLDEIEAPADSISFGYEMTITDDQLFVSGYTDDGTVEGTEVGAVYVYDLNNISAAPQEIRSPLEAQGYQFGNTLAAYDNMVAIGEHKAGQGATITSSGAVHLYDTDTGNFIKSLTPTSTTLDSGDEFGSKISMNDKFIAVSASGDDDKGQDAGAVYIFDKVTGIELAKITNNQTKGFAESIELDGDQVYIGAIKDSEGKTESGAVFQYDLSGLKVPEAPTETTAQPTINISTEDLAATDLTSISNGNTEEAEAILAQVDGLLAGLDAFEGTVSTASNKLESKITTLSSQKEILREQNAIANQELAEAEAAAKKVKFKANPNSSSNKKSSEDLSNSLTTIDEAYKYIDANMSEASATKLKTYLNTFIFSEPETAFETHSGVSPSLTSDLLAGIG